MQHNCDESGENPPKYRLKPMESMLGGDYGVVVFKDGRWVFATLVYDGDSKNNVIQTRAIQGSEKFPVTAFKGWMTVTEADRIFNNCIPNRL